MAQPTPIQIPLSKQKITFLLLGALLFVVLGAWLVLQPEKFAHGPGSLLGRPTVRVVGIAGILFFGICAVYAFRKLLDNKPGLIIDETGLTDNSGGVSAGHILWTDISDLSVISIQKQQFILLRVRNPQDYIDRQKGTFRKKMMQLNFKLYGSPLTITANGLKMTFAELHRLIAERVQAARK